MPRGPVLAPTLVLVAVFGQTAPAPAAPAAREAQVPTRNFEWISKEFVLDSTGMNRLGDIGVSPDGTLLILSIKWADHFFSGSEIYGTILTPGKAGTYKKKKARKLADDGFDPEAEWIQNGFQAFWAKLDGEIEGQRVKASGKPKGKPVTIADSSAGEHFGIEATAVPNGTLLAYARVSDAVSSSLQSLSRALKPTGSATQIHSSDKDDTSFPTTLYSREDGCRLVVIRQIDPSGAHETYLVLLDANGVELDRESFEARAVMSAEDRAFFGLGNVLQRRDDGSLHVYGYTIFTGGSGTKEIDWLYWGKVGKQGREYLLAQVLDGNPPFDPQRLRRTGTPIGIAYNTTDSRFEIMRADADAQTVSLETLMEADSVNAFAAAWVAPEKGDANAVIAWAQGDPFGDVEIRARLLRID